ncbi:MAG: sensor histidine kinase [Vicinamibacterales bacterium]
MARRFWLAAARYAGAAAAFFLLLGAMLAGERVGVRLDLTPAIILLLIGSAWFGGFGPGLLIAVLFEATIDYFGRAGAAHPRQFATTIVNRLLLFVAVVWFASSRRTAERRLRMQQRSLEETLGRERTARAEAEAANRSKDEFLATVSHELRTPLNVIVGWAAMLARHNLSADAAQRAADAIERSAHTQTRIVEDLLDASSMAAGRLRIKPQRVLIAPVVEEAIETMKPAAAAKRLIVDVSLQQTIAVMGDPDRLRQIAWNLISNAIKFTAPDGRITVRVDGEGTMARISVADDGIGMAREFLPHAFEPFRQADGSMTRDQGGLGLGLAIVHQLVDLHGGTVSAESAGVGKGARFVVNLPTASAAGSPAAPEAVAVQT